MLVAGGQGGFWLVFFVVVWLATCPEEVSQVAVLNGLRKWVKIASWSSPGGDGHAVRRGVRIVQGRLESLLLYGARWLL